MTKCVSYKTGKNLTLNKLRAKAPAEPDGREPQNNERVFNQHRRPRDPRPPQQHIGPNAARALTHSRNIITLYMLLLFSTTVTTGELAKCAGWCNEWTTDKYECEGCQSVAATSDVEATSDAAATSDASAAAPATYSYSQCIGDLAVSGGAAWQNTGRPQLVRNTGGGTSACCSMHPTAAGARIEGHAFELALEP